MRSRVVRAVAVAWIGIGTLVMLVPHAMAEPPAAPNIVIIFTGDQGYADAGVFGGQGFQTPHLDRMTSEGVRPPGRLSSND